MYNLNNKFSFKLSRSTHSLFGVLFILLAIPITVYLVITARQYQTPAQTTVPSTPLIDTKESVVIAERKLCSFVSQNQTSVGITGEDGGESVRVGATTYFAFGDTTTTGPMLPNSVATTTDTDASDCFTMTSKSVSGVSVPMLPKLPTECTVWPLDLVNTAGNDIYFFYYSFSSTNCTQRLGMGLGKMDALSLNTTRINNFFWQPGDSVTPNFDIYGAAFTKVGTDLYVVWGGEDNTGKDLTMLSKVPVVSIENKAAYTYWDGTSFQADPAKLKPIWDQGGVPTHGMTLRFNSFLNKWAAVYNTGYSSIMAMRTADSITGPWSGETRIVNCLQHYALGTTASTAFPCYGAKEHPEYEKNNGQIIYASHSNSVLYQPFLHEITFGKAVNQWVDTLGNSAYKQDGQNVANFSQEGAAFYASPNPLTNFVAIKDWVTVNGEHIYRSTSPGNSFTDSGTAFYAPTSQQYSLAPIYQWDKGTTHRYSALDLTSYGYTKGPLSFYAKITNYRVLDSKVFPQTGSLFQIGAKLAGSWVSGVYLQAATFASLSPSSKYSIVTSTPLAGNKFFGQNIQSDMSGKLSFSGDLAYINILNLGIFSENQPLDLTSDLFTYWVHHTGVFDTPAEISHQLNPYSQAPNFKSFFLTSPPNGTYQGAVCKPDCSGPVVWSGATNFCNVDLTLTSTGPTVCSQLTNFTLTNTTPSTSYDIYYCVPSCDDALVTIVYPLTSDVNGQITLLQSVKKLGDINGDGLVNSADLAILLSTWGSATDLRADISTNGKINSADLAILLSRWGS